MTQEKLPSDFTKAVSVLWLLTAPFLWLGAALSKMDSVERYNLQLAVASAAGVLALVSAYGAFTGRVWARRLLIAITWPAAACWLAAGYSLWAFGYVFPLLMGVFVALLAASLHVTRRPADHA